MVALRIISKLLLVGLGGFASVMFLCWLFLAAANRVVGGPFWWPMPGLN